MNSSDAQPADSDNRRIDVAIAEYFHRVDAGTTVDINEFLVEFDDVADELREFFEAANLLAAIPTPGQLADTQATMQGLQAGQSIGRYKLLQTIGEGGFGVVYMAEQNKPVQRRVALKVIKPGMDSAQVIARFEAERQALAMMEHPNIARVFEAGVTDTGRPYFVMELVKGLPITDFCDDKKLTIVDRLKLFIEVCRAVQHAHQKGIIHRDIKPSNVLVAMYDTVPVPKIIDFGVAKAVSQKLTDRTMFTQFGQIIGTLEYMSPEQAQFNQLDVDTRSDIYSLGVLLYELLTGETPIDGKRLRSSAFDEMLRIIREEEPEKPSHRISTLGEKASRVSAGRDIEQAKLGTFLRGDLDWIVMKSLEKERSRRYETACNLANDIARYLQDEPVDARPPSTRYRIQKLVQRNRVFVFAALTVATTLVLATVLSVWQAGRATSERDRALAAEQLASTARREAVAKQRQLQATLNELHTALIDKINLEMAGADEAKLRAAIDQAEKAGVTESDLRFLRGQHAYFFGRPADAIEILRPISESSVAALALLAEALLESGTPTERDGIIPELLRRVRKVESLSPLDRLFAALALMDKHSSTSRQLVSGVLDDRDSPFNRLIVGKVLAAYAHETFNREVLNEAMQHISSAIAYGGKSPGFLHGRLMVDHVAWTLGVDANLEYTDEDIAFFEQAFEENPMGRSHLVRLLSDMGHMRARDLAESYIADAAEVEVLYYVPILLQHHTPSEVLRFLEQGDTRSLNKRHMMARLMALIPERHEEARAACVDLFAADNTCWARTNCCITLNLLGCSELARERSRELVDSTLLPVWYHANMLEYFAGRIDAATLLTQSKGPVDELHARFALATEQLGLGEIDAAKANLRACIKLGQFHSENYHFAKAFLLAIETNHIWVNQSQGE